MHAARPVFEQPVALAALFDTEMSHRVTVAGYAEDRASAGNCSAGAEQPCVGNQAGMQDRQIGGGLELLGSPDYP